MFFWNRSRRQNGLKNLKKNREPQEQKKTVIRNNSQQPIH